MTFFSSNALKRWKRKVGLGKKWNSKNNQIKLSSSNYVNAFDPSFTTNLINDQWTLTLLLIAMRFWVDVCGESPYMYIKLVNIVPKRSLRLLGTTPLFYNFLIRVVFKNLIWKLLYTCCTWTPLASFQVQFWIID